MMNQDYHMENKKNYYEILEVPPESTTDEIHNGYIRAKSAYSQDSVALYSIMSQDECDSILNLIEEAYSILGDTSKRRQYDEVKGFNRDYDPDDRRESVAPLAQVVRHASVRPDAQKRPEAVKRDISKIVAQKRFSLDYDSNTDIEKEIEQTTDFTGAFLKRVREYKNVDIVRMADMTKVSKTYLLNIEDEDIDKLPALVYVRGFVYQYAKCLKLNPELVATSYLYRLKRLKEERSIKK